MPKKIVIAFVLLFNIFFSYQCFAEAEFDGYIVTLKQADTVSLFSGEASEIYEDIQPVVAEENIYKVNTEEELNKLIESGVVEYAEPDHIVTLFDSLFTPKDYYYNRYSSSYNVDYQYGVRMTKFDSVWDMGIFGNEVVVGVIDSGIFGHYDLQENTLPGYNFTVKSTVCSKGSDCTNPDCEHFDYTDTYMHGTFCSGIIAAAANSSGIIGASPAVKLVPLKSFDEKSAYVSDIVPAIYAAVDDFGCDVINMSFGLYSDNSTLRNAVAYAKKNNVLMVAAAGNDKRSITSVYPGSYSGVVCVGAVDSEGAKSDFSNYGSCIDIAAPGTSIYSCTITNSIGKNSGTSFATPYVTSAGAICKMLKPDITNDEFESLVKSSATPFSDNIGSYKLGSGILNAENMALSLLEEKGLYYSPINRFNDVTFRMITNLTGSDFSFADVWKGVDEYKIEDITLPSSAIYYTEFEQEADCTHYVWESIQSLKPLRKEEFYLNN